MRKKLKKILGVSLNSLGIAVLLSAVVVADVILSKNYSTVVNTLCPPKVDQEAFSASAKSGQELADKIETEGIVLTRNVDNLLPLSKTTTTKVNVFGYSNLKWTYCGSGSGEVRKSDGSATEDESFTNLLGALDEFGISYNQEIIDMYKSYRNPSDPSDVISNEATLYSADSEVFKMYEPSISDKNYYSDKLLANAKSYSDTAIVTISRRAGESSNAPYCQYKGNGTIDETRTYLEISKEEEELLKYVGNNFANVIVVINSTNAMKLDFLETINNLGACIVVGATGTKAARAIPYIIYGEDADGEEVSPSGRLTDTYAYDFKSNVNYQYAGTIGTSSYTNSGNLYPVGVGHNGGHLKNNENRTAAVYNDYIEGIYVGYKWYETADKEGVWNSVSNSFGKGYDGVVQYPFGYGLSYTDFKWTLEDVSMTTETLNENSVITFTVNVENVGSYSGKDVVELYVTKPYTKGGIEKSYVQLVGFGKTETLKPGNSQKLTIEATGEDLMSYDCYDKDNNGFKGYELEEGAYEFKLMSDSHNLKDSSLTKTYSVASTINVDKDLHTGATVSNKFTGENAVDGASVDGSDGTTTIDFISRSSFPNPFEMNKTPERAISEKEKTHNLFTAEELTSWDNATTDVFGNKTHTESVTWNAKNNLSITNSDGTTISSLGYELGEDYNDSNWDKLLDQMSPSEALTMIGNAYLMTAGISSIGKPETHDYDGPSQIRSFTSAPRGTGYPCSIVLAQTWNSSLAHQYGLAFANDMNVLSADSVYGFSTNIHRSIFQGRNYEYFSEDQFLSGILLTQELRGLKEMGKVSYVKHFALAQNEYHREASYNWITEQALREVYLKPFEMAIHSDVMTGLMTSYNRTGNTWAGASEALIAGVLRTEWGFNGAVITDYSDHVQYMNEDSALRAGGDLGMKSDGTMYSNYHLEYSTKSTNRLQYQLREAVHHVTYAYLSAKAANKDYLENGTEETTIIASNSSQSWNWVKPVWIDLNIAAGLGILIWGYFTVRNCLVKKEEGDHE